MSDPRSSRRRGIAVVFAVLVAAGIVAVSLRGGDPVPAAPAPAAARAGTGGLPSFLVVVPDTFRADRVGHRVDGRSITPNLDALAARGAWFTQAWSQSGWTFPALAALLSGRYPLAPRAEDEVALDFMRTDLPTLPEHLRAAGYHTAVFWGEFMGKAPAEFSRGFDHVARETGDDFAAGVVDWLRAEDRRPFFVLVHNTDLQFPVVAAPGHPLLGTLPPSATVGLEPTFQRWVGQAALPVAQQAAVLAYDLVVARYDAAIGQMLAGLEAAGAAGDTVVVVTSNHGLELAEHGHFKHGLLNDYDLHVPLIVADPRAPTPGLRVDTVVQTVDLAPTILDRAGRPVGEEMHGKSWRSLLGLGGGAYTARDVYALSSTTSMAVRGTWAKVVRSAPKGAGEDAMVTVAYDLRQDPLELRPYPGSDPAVADLVAGLDRWWAERAAETAAARPSGADPAALKRLLQENGYWGVMTGSGEGK